jgi:Family of unknown function (DUF5677)
MSKKRPAFEVEVRGLLKALRNEVVQKTKCRPTKEGLFKAVLKASFVRIHEYVEFVYSDASDSGPRSFFASAPLRQCCEDLIALKYLATLKRKDRDAAIQALMIISTGKASEKQSEFVKRNHPYQPVLTSTFPLHQIEKAREVLSEVGTRSGLWHTRNKLPPIEQMAVKVGLSEFYEYLYAATSEIVHFNVRIASRSGWGSGKNEFNLSPSNFAKFYAQFDRIYAAYVWFSFCREFRSALQLSPEFMNVVDSVEQAFESVYRWPELVKFEAMNVPQNEDIILRAILEMKQRESIEKLREKHANRRSRSHNRPSIQANR